MDRIINAIHDTVPPELWEVIVQKIDGPVAADTPVDEFDECDGAEDICGPMESGVADEDCWTDPGDQTHQWKAAAPPLGPSRPRPPR